MHNVKDTARLTAVGTGAVLNLAASGTGAVLNFASQQLPKPLTAEEHRLREAHQAQVAKNNAATGALARLHANALVQQEERRASEEAERKREIEEAVANAQAQELQFQDARSVASSVVRAKHGVGRRGNVTRSLQGRGRQPAKEQLVRNEPEGMGNRAWKGILQGANKVAHTVFPPPAGFEYR